MNSTKSTSPEKYTEKYLSLKDAPYNIPYTEKDGFAYIMWGDETLMVALKHLSILETMLSFYHSEAYKAGYDLGFTDAKN